MKTWLSPAVPPHVILESSVCEAKPGNQVRASPPDSMVGGWLSSERVMQHWPPTLPSLLPPLRWGKGSLSQGLRASPALSFGSLQGLPRSHLAIKIRWYCRQELTWPQWPAGPTMATVTQPSHKVGTQQSEESRWPTFPRPILFAF